MASLEGLLACSFRFGGNHASKSPESLVARDREYPLISRQREPHLKERLTHQRERAGLLPRVFDHSLHQGLVGNHVSTRQWAFDDVSELVGVKTSQRLHRFAEHFPEAPMMEELVQPVGPHGHDNPGVGGALSRSRGDQIQKVLTACCEGSHRLLELIHEEDEELTLACAPFNRASQPLWVLHFAPQRVVNEALPVRSVPTSHQRFAKRMQWSGSGLKVGDLKLPPIRSRPVAQARQDASKHQRRLADTARPADDSGSPYLEAGKHLFRGNAPAEKERAVLLSIR